MAVIERGTIKILSKNDLRELERDVVKQEKLAGRADIASAKIAQRVGPTLPSAITKRRKKLSQLGLFGGRGEESILAQKQKDVIKRTEKNADFLDKILIRSGLRKGNPKSLISAAGSPIKTASEFKKLEAQVAKNTIGVNAIQKVVGKFTPLIQGGAAGAGSKIFFSQGLASITKIVLPVAIVTMIAQAAIQLWIDSYGKGGVNDPRKPIKDDVKSIIDLQFEESIISAKLYFANSRTLKPGQETRSNTMNLKDGHNRSRIARVPYGR